MMDVDVVFSEQFAEQYIFVAIFLESLIERFPEFLKAGSVEA